MTRRILVTLCLLLGAVVLQTLLPLVWGDLTVGNPYLALLVVLALRTGKAGGVLWGALLGCVSDAYFMPYIGFHGLSMSIAGYLLGWAGSKFLIRGILPVALFAFGAQVLDTALVAGLHLLLGLPLASPIWIAGLLGALLTGGFAALFEPFARRFYLQDRP
jgi:rod shape-determining protein MreD